MSPCWPAISSTPRNQGGPNDRAERSIANYLCSGLLEAIATISQLPDCRRFGSWALNFCVARHPDTIAFRNNLPVNIVYQQRDVPTVIRGEVARIRIRQLDL